MTTNFTAQVYQNAYLPEGTQQVNAIMTISADGEEGIQVTSNADRVFGIICDISGSMDGEKIVAAKNAIAKLIQIMPQDTKFFIVVGASKSVLLCPTSVANVINKEAAIARLKTVTASGGTVISTWLKTALNEFQKHPQAIRQALLLTDGQNNSGDANELARTLQACENQFQCDCRGVGTDWEVAELKKIAQALLGTTDLIANASAIETDFQGILGKALSKNVSDVSLRLWTPQGAKVLFCKQVSPEIVDITQKAKVINERSADYPTGSWGTAESRDYHFCIQVNAGNVGDEMLAGRASLIYSIDGVETKVAESKILAIWTDDELRSAKIDRTVAHYTGQAELAQSIQEGLEARAQGNLDVATAKLSRAVQIAHESNNEATTKLLRQVVEIDDASTGTIRIKRNVQKEDEMALETRSTKTARIKRPT